MSIVRFALGSILRVVSDHLLGVQPDDGKAEPPKAAEEAPPTSVAKPRDRSGYNVREHKTYYMVGSDILYHLLNHNTPLSVRDFVAFSEDEFAQSTVRGICKELVKDGLLVQMADYPATFQIAEGMRDPAQEFVDKHHPTRRKLDAAAQ